MPCLRGHVQEHRESKVIVYFLTCACVDFFATVLERLPAAHGLAVTPLHGRMKQAAREAALAAFADAPAGEPRWEFNSACHLMYWRGTPALSTAAQATGQRV